MNSKERILAVYSRVERKALDRVPSHVQYVDPEFISKYSDYFLDTYDQNVFNQYFGAPYVLGFDSVFAPIPESIKFRSLKLELKGGEKIRIGVNGQSVKAKTTYYEGGYVTSLEILNQMKDKLKFVEKKNQIKAVLNNYEKFEQHIYPIVMVDGIFDKTWQAMGMTEFSKHYRKKSELYKKLISFYAEIMKSNVRGIIEASDKSNRIINILDDVAYRGRTMISPTQWEQDFMPYYKEVTDIISSAGMIPQVHTDGDPTELIPYFQKAGFRGLQGWEGGADPFFINEHYPEFAVLGFGDVSHILPYGTKTQIEAHVQQLMDALKENRHFIIGPSTIIYEKIPLENVLTFMRAVKKFGKY
jgi:hypothetical protein